MVVLVIVSESLSLGVVFPYPELQMEEVVVVALDFSDSAVVAVVPPAVGLTVEVVSLVMLSLLGVAWLVLEVDLPAVDSLRLSHLLSVAVVVSVQ